MLEERIKKEMTDAMKSADKFRLSVLRMLKSAIQLETINKKDALTDEEIVNVIKKQVKLRKESREEYIKYERQDLVDDLTKEIDILSVYVPEGVSEEVIIKTINEIFEELNPQSVKEIGLIMKNAKEKLGNNADMSLVNKIVKEKLEK